jgi:hypothetical protein
MKLFLGLLLVSVCYMEMASSHCVKSSACNTYCDGEGCEQCTIPKFLCSCDRVCFDTQAECDAACGAGGCNGNCSAVDYTKCPGAAVYSCPCGTTDAGIRCFEQKVNCDKKCDKDCNGKCIADTFANCQQCLVVPGDA